MAVMVMGAATVIGISAVPAVAGGAPVNLIQNGNFVPTTSTTGYLTVSAGDSTSIPGWTVVTPSVYDTSGGSVDVVSDSYWNDWNNEAGGYSIDLAGTTGVPGGLYQNVATTPGVEYSLSFWSAANGDETPAGNDHTTGVSVNGSLVDTVTNAGGVRPLEWVQNTVTFTATSATSKIEFDDTTLTDTDFGPTLDNVSLTAVSDVVSGSPETIPPQVTGKQFTVPVATFTDSDTAAAPPQLSATINWGDGTTPLPAGVITGSGGSYTVTGTHTYAANGTYGPVVVTITDADASAPVTVTDNSVQVASAVTSCTGSCTTTVQSTSQNPVNAQVSTTGTGYVLVSTFPNSGAAAFTCSGDGFRHAPSDVQETNTFTSGTATVTATDVFPAKDGTTGSGLEGLLFWVCFKSNAPFKDLTGQTVTTGLLPLCNPFKPGPGPCINYILPTSGGNITEQITYPAADPIYR
jgi:Protein of unknown function (DUF642)